MGYNLSMTDEEVQAEFERLKASPEAKAEWQTRIANYGGSMSFERWCRMRASEQDSVQGFSPDGKPVGQTIADDSDNGE